MYLSGLRHTAPRNAEFGKITRSDGTISGGEYDSAGGHRGGMRLL